MIDMGPILAELKQLRQENELLKEMLVDTYGFGWPMEFASREKARLESIKGKYAHLKTSSIEFAKRKEQG